MSLEVESIGNITSPEDLLNVNPANVATNGILKIGMVIARQYVEGKWELSMLARCNSYVSILKWCYYACVARKLCPPIEQLDEGHKKELWRVTRTEIDPETRVKSRLMDLTKAQYAMTELAKLVYKNQLEE